jgi:predicted PurR-regulated permease PerM
LSSAKTGPDPVGLPEVTQVELFRPRRDKGKAAPVKEPEAPVKEPEPPESTEDIWAPAAQVATVGIFVLLFVAALYMCRPVLLPVVAAMVVGTTLAPIVKGAARHRISPWVTAIALGVVLVAAAALAVTLLAQPVSEWITKAPDIGAAIRQKLYVLDRPLAALRELQEVLRPSAVNQVAIEPSQWGVVTPVIVAVTPAVVEITLFFVTLIFFLATQMDFRRYTVSFFATRNAKLRFIRITNDLESYLASYVAIVTVINFGLGVVVAIGAWLFGLPNPILFGLLAMALNYIPYIGAACMTLVLLGVGLVSFPSLTFALVPAAAFVAVATIEGQFVTPTVLGRSLTLNPLVVLLALAFWAWLWGPMGAFLAVPLTIVALVVLHHLFPPDEDKLPT